MHPPTDPALIEFFAVAAATATGMIILRGVVKVRV